MKIQLNSNFSHRYKQTAFAWERQKSSVLTFFLLFFYTFTVNAMNKPPMNKHVVIGYIAGYAGLIDIKMIKPEKLTHLNYAFANIKNNRISLSNAGTDTVNLKNLNTLKIKNPNLKILVSVGGWSYSGNFSDMALSDSSRKAFGRSAAMLVNKYKLDGIDIDWEFPGLPGAGNVHRFEDKHNFTLLMKACREELDRVGRQDGKKLMLTVAADCSQIFLDHTEMDSVQAYLDYINLMTYDFLTEIPNLTFHAAGLFPSKKMVSNNTICQSVLCYLKAGVLPEKMVLGIPFYGHLYHLKKNVHSASGAEIKEHIGTQGFTFIKDSLINSNHFQYHRDRTAKAAYLFSPHDKQFVTFDDEWSVKHKCRYVRKHKLAGIMFWEYSSDEKGYLLEEINKKLMD